MLRTMSIASAVCLLALDALGQTPEDQEERIKQLEKKVEELSRRLEESEQERLVQDAEVEAAKAPAKAPEERQFGEGALSLQRLNPEVSISGDVVAALVLSGSRTYATEEDRSGFILRGLGLHLQSMLDPYSLFKSAVHFGAEGVGLEELYVVWHGLVPNLSFWVGRFRQNFGVVNRWHEHELDQIEHPLALKLILGDEGLAGEGFGLRYLLPRLWAHANELTLEVTNGTNEKLFSGKHFSIPTGLLHLKNYYDLSRSTYLELGLTGVVGVNNRVGFLDGDRLRDEDWRLTYCLGADLTLYWSPPSKLRYQSVTWRTEALYADKQVEDGHTRAWGVYSYLQWQPAERWFLGVRGDAVLPLDRESDKLTFDVVPWVTFWQSEFVYLRLEYRHGWRMPYEMASGGLGRRTDDRVLLQVDFAAGPHKHEKY